MPAHHGVNDSHVFKYTARLAQQFSGNSSDDEGASIREGFTRASDPVFYPSCVESDHPSLTCRRWVGTAPEHATVRANVTSEESTTNAIVFFAIIGVIGMAAQWFAWRFRIPAIIILLIAGLILGPVTGLLSPSTTLGPMVRPMVAVAVAIILFEGGLSLDFRGLRAASEAIWRIVVFAAPLMWLAIACAAHYVGKLTWPTAAVIGGILVVTGPTVVQPLLRTAKMDAVPSAVLRWEAIVNDPIGALFAVLAFEVFVQVQSGRPAPYIAAKLALSVAESAFLGFVLGRAVALAYRTTQFPEYLKVPTLFVLVLASFAAGNSLLDGAGLLTVMVMGMTLGNSRIASLTEIRRFKEHAAVLLVSGVFVILTSDIQPQMLRLLDWHSAAFAALLLFVIRPAAILVSTAFTHLGWRKILLIAWVAPRGVVAVATAAVFGDALVAHGASDGEQVPALTFAIVLVTVILFGFTTAPLARRLKLALTSASGVLIVGCNPWTLALAEALKSLDISVMIADRAWRQLKPARDAAIPTYFGEILAEAAEHRLDHAMFGQVIAATDSHAYNTLVCTDLGPQFGRQHVFQIGRSKSDELDPEEIALSLGGRTLMMAGYDLDSLLEKLRDGWVFRKTKLSEEFNFAAFSASLPAESQLILSVSLNGTLNFPTVNEQLEPPAGASLLTFTKKEDR
jgi:NhaP-type Na+/H+ or K+/H+ antiporter